MTDHDTRSALFRRLSKDDLIDVLEFSDQAVRARTHADLQKLVDSLMNALPIQAIDIRTASLGAANDVIGTSALLSVNFPTNWSGEFRRRGLRAVDPVSKLLYSGAGPLIWSKLRERYQGAGQQAFFRTAAEYGLKDGFATGQVFAGRRTGSFISCISEDLAKHERHEAMLQVLAPHLHSALARLSAIGEPLGKALTSREIAVLDGAKSGKTNLQIGRDLSISARTVKFHLDNAVEKLGARNRTEAISIAMARGLAAW